LVFSGFLVGRGRVSFRVRPLSWETPMTPDDWENLADVVQGFSTAVAVIIGGLWVFWNFWLKRESHAKVQFDLDLQPFNTVSQDLIVDVVAMVENKGQVRHWLRDFKFDLLVHRCGVDVVEGGERIGNQVLFEKVLANRYWVPDEWKATFIDAGCTQNYRYVAHIPRDTDLVLIYGRFKYPDEQSEFHTAQKVFDIRSLLACPTTSTKLAEQSHTPEPAAGPVSHGKSSAPAR
jgi:hypothetical protein